MANTLVDWQDFVLIGIKMRGKNLDNHHNTEVKVRNRNNVQ
jgi:hypothetical protein